MSSKQRPNIVFIMADDHAANAIGAYGSRLMPVANTPNIDRIGKEGVRLTNAFCTNAICTPSRATILTGQYSHVNGVRTLSDALDITKTTFPSLLQAAGYQTAVVGKWHVHSEPQGFDYYDILPKQGTYRDPRFISQPFDWSTFRFAEAEGLGEQHAGHVTDIITEKSLAWLESCVPDQPFLLMCHHMAPHSKFEYQERFENLLESIDVPEPASLWEDRGRRSVGSRDFGASVSERNPTFNAVSRLSQPNYPTGRLDVRSLAPDERTKAAYQKYLKDYIRTAKGVDESVGTIIDYLDVAGLSEDTVVIYTSDQGMFLGEHDFIDKRWIYEEAMRMPMLVRYTGTIAPGSIVEELVSNVDLAPTLLDFAGLEVPDEMQGQSFFPILRGESSSSWPNQIYYRYWMHLADTDNPAHFGIRTSEWKLVFFYGLPLDATDALPELTSPAWELYDLRNDPDELDNVIGRVEYQEVAVALKGQLEQLRLDVGDDDSMFPEVAERMASSWMMRMSAADAQASRTSTPSVPIQ